MDSRGFDALIRRLAQRPTRRDSLGVLGGLLAAPVLARPVLAGKKKRAKKSCPPCRGRKKGKCRKVLGDGTACAGGTCQGGACVPAGSTTPVPCQAGFTRCGDACVNLRLDPGHCGACGKVCGSEVCINGACRCGTDLPPCSGTCACVQSVGGLSACTSANVNDSPCTANAECPVGSVCLQEPRDSRNFNCTRTCAP